MLWPELIDRLNYLDGEIFLVKEDIQYLRDKATNATAGVKAARVQTSGYSNPVEFYACRIADKEKKLAKLMQAKKKVTAVFHASCIILDDRERQILTMRYIGNKSIAEISGSLNCSRRNIYRIHNRAVQRIERL
jgi:RNA polymerase sigma factor (sigma-70 family)